MTSDWQGFQFHELTAVRSPDEADERRTALLLAPLTGSHTALLAGTAPALAPALVTAWIRPPYERRLRIFVGGRPYFPPALDSTGEPSSVLFPPGAMARPRPHRDVAGLLDLFRHWVPCVARPDVLSAAEFPPTKSVGRGTFDRHVAYLGVPFAWVVVAEPLAASELEPELRSLVNEILPLSRGEVGEAKRVELERRRARHRELSRAVHAGGWRIRVQVGTIDPESATTVAAMLCAARGLDDLPYVLRPADPAEFRSACVSGTELVAALLQPPERELPGVHVIEAHTFDVTSEPVGVGGVRLGSVLDAASTEAGDLVVSADTLNRHVFVCGATGSGKSQTVRHLLTEASRVGLPWLVVEPAKAEYARMAGRLADLDGEVTVIRPGDPEVAPAGLNPLEPAPGFPLQSHADLLRALFLAAFEAQEPFPQILATALTRCYEELGWDLTLGESRQPGRRPRYPSLGDLQRVAQTVVTEIGYGKEIANNVRGFIAVRVNSLRMGTTGRFFEGGHPLDFERLLQHNVVLEIEDVGDDADKAFFMGAILLRLSEHLRVAARNTTQRRLAHLTVIEEAHRLLRGGQSGAAGHAVEMFAAMLAEVRAYGEGLIIAEQIPSKLSADVIKNTAVKVMHRLPARDDRDSVGATMNLNEAQSRQVVTFVPGRGAAFTDGMDRPVLISVPDGAAAEAEPGRLSPPTALVGRRSPSCTGACAAMPCTLRQMRNASYLLASAPWLIVWAELAVLAQLTGQPMPIPIEAVRSSLDQPRSLVGCALSHAVDSAVAARVPLLPPDTDPTDLACHTHGVLTGILDGASHGCHTDDLRYLATPFRWERVRRELATTTGEGRDPRTAEWERAYGRAIPGETRDKQLRVVTEWLIADLRDEDQRDAVTYGTLRPSDLERAMGADPGTALGWFVDCTWPAKHLRGESG